jgi:hypothetical protein
MNHSDDPRTDDSRSQRIQHFVDRIPKMLAACAYAHHIHAHEFGCRIDALETQVELCDESGRASVAHCKGHYAYWGTPASETTTTSFLDTLKRNCGPEVLAVYEVFCQARFAAWRYTPGGERHPATATALDGRRESRSIEVIHATTTEGAPLRHETIVAGWMIEVEGVTMLLLGCEFEDRARQKLAVAAARSAWGDAHHFRAGDYEADMLGLLFEPMAVDVGGRGVCVAAGLGGVRWGGEHLGSSRLDRERGGRVFLSPVIKGWGWGLAAIDLPAALQSRLAEHGLEHRGEFLPWHLAVAQAESTPDLEDLMGQLTRARQKSVTERLEPRHPIGEHTLEVLISSAHLMQTVGLTNDGVLDEREDYLELTLRQLGFECDELWHCGVDPDSPLEETLRHTALLSPAALDALGDAIYLARVRVRWTTIVRCWLAEDSPWKSGPSLVELLVGIKHLFRTDLWHLPVDQLPADQLVAPCAADQLPVDHLPALERGTWRRLADAVHSAGFTGVKVRIADLYEFVGILSELPGVGPNTIDHARLALASLLSHWPSGPGWLPQKPSIFQAS